VIKNGHKDVIYRLPIGSLFIVKKAKDQSVKKNTSSSQLTLKKKPSLRRIDVGERIYNG